jgi:dihydrofolate reductase
VRVGIGVGLAALDHGERREGLRDVSPGVGVGPQRVLHHVPVFVLTHHARPPLTMEGGTTFHFVTDGIQAALKRAKEAARGKDVRLGGGAATIRQYLAAGLVDHVVLAK